VDLDRSFGFLVNDVARPLRAADSISMAAARRLGLTRGAMAVPSAILARKRGHQTRRVSPICLKIRPNGPAGSVRSTERKRAGWIEPASPIRATAPRAPGCFLTEKRAPQSCNRVWDVASDTRRRGRLTRLSAPEAEQFDQTVATAFHGKRSASVSPP